jgi:hypothetical protein
MASIRSRDRAWSTIAHGAVADKPPDQKLPGDLYISDDRLSAVIHMNMLNPHKLRAAVPETS